MRHQPPGDGSDNPYAPPGPGITLGTEPEHVDRGLLSGKSAEDERRANLAAEATARSIGIYYCIGSASALLEAGMAARDGTTLGVISKLIQFSFLLILGYYLLYFKNWARWAAIVTGCLDVLAWGSILLNGTSFPLTNPLLIRAVLSLFFLVYVVTTLFTGGIGRVFSSRYKAVVRLTPQLHSRFGMIDQAFLRLCVLAQLVSWLVRSI